MSTTTGLVSRRLRAGLYVLLTGPAVSPTMDGRFEVERVDGEFGTEWRLFECADGYRGEWCQTFATKADAVAAARDLHADAA